MTRLFSLVYSSDAAITFDSDDLAALLNHSRAANAERDITGMLVYRARRFVQVLEGPETEVRGLADTIAADPRHVNMQVLLTDHPPRRRFTDWTMGYEPIAEPVEPLPEGFRSTFDDLEATDDPATVLRSLGELSVWFRARSARRR